MTPDLPIKVKICMSVNFSTCCTDKAASCRNTILMCGDNHENSTGKYTSLASMLLAPLDAAVLMIGKGNKIEPARLAVGWKRSR